MQNPLKTVWNRLDRIVGPMSISVLFGKFTGDSVANYLKTGTPPPEWMAVGVLGSILLFIAWPILEKTYDSYRDA